MKSEAVINFIKGKNFPDVTNAGSIEIIGDKKIIIEHAQSILEYENERVRVNTGRKTVVVTGEKLSLDSYSENVILINGNIISVSFE